MDFELLFPLAQAINLLFHPHGEVVIHDLKTGKIATIYNNLSKRKVGDESLIEELADHSKFPDLFPLYIHIVNKELAFVPMSVPVPVPE